MQLFRSLTRRIKDGLAWRYRNFRHWYFEVSSRGERRKWEEFGERLKAQDIINRDFDARWGTETSAEHALEATGVSLADARRGNMVYRPFWEKDFRAVLSQFDLDWSEYTFIDIGSGKGKLLMLATEMPFKKIIGLEYSPGLHEVAQRNIEIFAKRHARPLPVIEALHGDALEYHLPSGAIFCLIFNSLDRPTTRKVLARFARDVQGRSDPVFVAYANLRNVSEIGGAFRSTGCLRTLLGSTQMIILGNKAARHALTNKTLVKIG